MRKNLSLGIVFLTVLLLSGCGQPRVANSSMVYTKIVEHNESSEQAFEKSKMWLANTFNDSKAVIEYENKENSTIIGQGIISKINYAFLVYGDTRFTITMENKDNKSRFTMKNMNITTWDKINGKLQYDMWNMEQFKIFSKEADKLTSSFKVYINNKPLKSDW